MSKATPATARKGLRARVEQLELVVAEQLERIDELAATVAAHGQVLSQKRTPEDSQRAFMARRADRRAGGE